MERFDALFIKEYKRDLFEDYSSAACVAVLGKRILFFSSAGRRGAVFYCLKSQLGKQLRAFLPGVCLLRDNMRGSFYGGSFFRGEN